MKKIFLIICMVILLTSCLPQQNAQNAPQKEQQSKELYSLTEISKHNTSDNCWLLISGKVYNVTSFIEFHPGQKNILQGCGKDATILFTTRPMGSGTDHSVRAKSMLDDYYIGDLNSNDL